mmetsp:Transcript_63876/g.144099  ORF Transcript_63876/g.144099 Transcript_63876/m.144099 type:complete len:414 (+) Transcript_63876:361-1602(+)
MNATRRPSRTITCTRFFVLTLLGLWVVVLLKVTVWSGPSGDGKVDDALERAPLRRGSTVSEGVENPPLLRRETSQDRKDAVQGPEESDTSSSLHGSRSFLEPNCPEIPDKNYPMEWPILDVVKNWNPDVTEIPPRHFMSICRFDYATQLDAARAYRDAEVPFVVRNVPKMASTVKNWASLKYLTSRLGQTRSYMAEYSENNHFMYFTNKPNAPKGWKPPVETRRLTFPAWVEFAKEHENVQAKSLDTPHYYFRFDTSSAPWLREDLGVLTATGDRDGLFIVDRKSARGIFCRFGMRGIVAAAHYDGSRNFVTVMGGLRRYMISAPKNCEFMHLFPKNHPSGRHSQVDWSAPDLEKYPNFPQARVSELVLEPGDFLYIPSGWLHYVMSLNMNWQCNARSGKGKGRAGDLSHCGF